MKKKILLRLLLPLLLFLVVYNFWAETGRARNKVTGWVTVPQISTHFEWIQAGQDSGKGQIIGIQPYLTARSYSTEFNLYVTLRLYLEQLKTDHRLDSPTVLFFPGDIGTWLLLAYEKESVYGAASFADCVFTMEQSNFYSFASHYLSVSPGEHRSLRALVNMKASGMAEMYQRIFSGLAKEYGVTLVAGSILLPSPKLLQGKIQTSRGELSQVSAVFGPDGAIIPPLAIWPARGTGPAAAAGEERTSWSFHGSPMQVLIKPFCDSGALLSRKPVSSPILLMPLSGGLVPGQAVCDTSIGSMRAAQIRVRNGMALALTGDFWDQLQTGNAFLWNDSCRPLPAAGRKGRIIGLWLR